MGVDRRAQLLQLLIARARLQPHRAADPLIAGAHAVVDREEPLEVDRAGELDRDALERDAECGGIGPVGDLLASAEGGEDQLDRVGPGIGAAERRRLVDHQPVVAQRRLRAQALLQARVRFEGHDRASPAPPGTGSGSHRSAALERSPAIAAE